MNAPELDALMRLTEELKQRLEAFAQASLAKRYPVAAGKCLHAARLAEQTRKKLREVYAYLD